MFKLPFKKHSKTVIAIISVGLVFAFAYFFYSNSTKSKASSIDCISKRICNSDTQCGQSGKCVFTDQTSMGLIGRCACSIMPIKDPTFTPAPTVKIPINTPTSSYSPTPSPTLTLPEYYLKTSEWISASPNTPSTVIFGCDPGDIAVGGGMDGYSGSLNIWRTVRSGPTNASDLNSWQTTIINESNLTYQFTVTAKCLRLNK